MSDRIPQSAIDSIAEHINTRNTKTYNIAPVGSVSKIETPQYFEIIPFDQIDTLKCRVYAIDGSTNAHSFYNGITIALYRGGYVCFQNGKQLRMNDSDDPVMLGKTYTPVNILITCQEHLEAIYDELLALPPVSSLLKFFGGSPDDVFAWTKDALTVSASNLLAFCQDVLEWALVYEIASRPETSPNDIILRDGTLRSLNIRQSYLVKLAALLSRDKKLRLVSVTKNSPIKVELTYTLRQIDNYLQDELHRTYPFEQIDPKRQKLCSWFEIRDDVLLAAYGNRSSNMYAKKAIKGGRGIGIFFAARLDYVEKLQNYDWVILDVNILDAIPDIESSDLKRNYDFISGLFYDLTTLTQEHYILGYPYPLVEVHNLVTLKSDFKEEVINRVKHSMYSKQHMDHIEIENMFLDIHSRF